MTPPFRLLLLAALTLVATPALADRITAKAPVVRVTLYPDGAAITRRVRIEAAPGAHEIVVPGLPEGIDPDSLRITATGARLGSTSLQQGRALPPETEDSAAILAAREAVTEAERALQRRDAETASIRAEAQAAEDTIAFLKALAQSDGIAPDEVATLAATVQAQILEARRAAIWAEDAARQSTEGREDAVRALDAARARLDALTAPDLSSETLVLLMQSEGDPVEIEITSQTPHANWRPVYDLRLDRAAGALWLDRGLIVAQSTGEDWRDVTLTLSTARPEGQSQPSELYPATRRIVLEDDASRYRTKQAPNAAMDALGYVAPVIEVEPVVVEEAAMSNLGLTIVYDYAAPVTIRTGVDALRLRLDDTDLTPQILAEGAPARDATAYLVAEGTNTTGEPILPGRATLYSDGAMVGQTDLPLIAAGDDIRLGFGPIDGLVLERSVPDRQEGGTGIIARRDTWDETATILARNLTDEPWSLRILDSVPVSEQEDLQIEWSADPAPTETAPDGKRGVLAWQVDLAPGAERQITTSVSMRWPDGYALID